MTVFDSTGRKVSDGPLHHAFGRQSVELDSTLAGAMVDVELFPGFAHLDPPDSWSADVRIAFTAREPLSLTVLGQSTGAKIRLSPHQQEGFQFSPVPIDFASPRGFTPFIEVRAGVGVGEGPVSVRQGSVGR